MGDNKNRVLYLIWSEKWCLYYRPNACGYTPDSIYAGRYSLEEAERRVKGCDYLEIRSEHSCPRCVRLKKQLAEKAGLLEWANENVARMWPEETYEGDVFWTIITYYGDELWEERKEPKPATLEEALIEMREKLKVVNDLREKLNDE